MYKTKKVTKKFKLIEIENSAGIPQIFTNCLLFGANLKHKKFKSKSEYLTIHLFVFGLANIFFNVIKAIINGNNNAAFLA